eukprot:3572686-Amphidinium_carterae.2
MVFDRHGPENTAERTPICKPSRAIYTHTIPKKTTCPAPIKAPLQIVPTPERATRRCRVTARVERNHCAVLAQPMNKHAEVKRPSKV